ncbi:MAG: hypothetical protein GX130_07505 [Candidatus Hydrogenedens sp.]|jgi:Zn-finger nucleic acid-binding protein|nr:hypothetical protein [Candidatus Hydrogenedens sp.]
MKCPACSDILLTLEYKKIEVDYCTSCLGIWLDGGELELLLGDARAREGFLTEGNHALASGEKKRPCPICDTLMNKEVTGGLKPVVYDCCPNGDGLWFDHGELLTIFEAEDIEGDTAALRSWLREVFPAENQQQGENQVHKGVSS